MIPWGIGFALVLVRTSTLLSTAPILGDYAPAPALAALSGVFALVAALPLGPYNGSLMLSDLLCAAIGEAAIGLFVAFTLRLLFSAFASAGQLVGTQMGMAFGGTIDPLMQEETLPVARLLMATASMAFIAAFGLEAMLQAWLHSFAWLPRGQAFSLPALPAVTHVLGGVMSSALALAWPVFAGMIVVNAGVALTARAAPELQILQLVFGVLLLVGLSLLRGVLAGSVSLASDYAQSFPAHLQTVWSP